VTHRYVIERLGREHDRSSFDCGILPLNRYIAEQASQDIRRSVTSCYVARQSDSPHVAGYHTIAMGGIPLAQFPPEIARKLPRYPSVPIARVGRLAVDMKHQGQGLGGVLLTNALARAHRSDIAAYAVVVDAKDDAAASFYGRQGFVKLESIAGGLFFPLGEFVRRIQT
jgi:ribosomal protein S18 acetylase RimI-like enzyme